MGNWDRLDERNMGLRIDVSNGDLLLVKYDTILARWDANNAMNIVGRMLGDSVWPTCTTAALTLAVSSSGSDTPTVTRPATLQGGDYSSEPFATIQAAIDSLPAAVVHAVRIDVAAGTFTGFELKNRVLFGGRYLDIYPKVEIKGASPVEVTTLATGPSSGTSTDSSGSNKTLTLTGAAWTVNDLRGKFLQVTSGTATPSRLYAIRSNTNEVITVTGKGDWFGSVNFKIVTLPTVLSEISTGVGTRIKMRDVVGVVSLQQFKFECTAADDSKDMFDVADCPSVDLDLRRFEMTSPDFAMIGARFEDVHRVYIEGLISQFEGGMLGTPPAPTFTHVKEVELHDFYTNDGKITFQWVGRALLQSFASVATINSSPVIQAFDSFIELGHECSFYKYNGQGAFLLRRSYLHAVYGPSEIEISNTGKPFQMLSSKVNLEAVVDGSSNSNFGIDASGFDNLLRFEQVPTISGTSGEGTVDGSTPLDWSTDFVSNGDYAEHAGTRCHILRSADKMTP